MHEVRSIYFALQSTLDYKGLMVNRFFTCRGAVAMKRTVDVIGAIGGLLAFALPMALIAIVILLADGPPVLFRQERLGRQRHLFTILKFRSMRNGEITGVGRVLRATGLDELPQFINILRGELSAVGPRPLTQADVLRLDWAVPDCDFRWTIRPGLTGLAQIVGARSARQSLHLDRRYIADQGLALDLRLIALSFAIAALGKHRARRLLIRRSVRINATDASATTAPARRT
jgi:lipopolysaccharide/colanic/teichoic acid biosynthesis glycosyltransferase